MKNGKARSALRMSVLEGLVGFTVLLAASVSSADLTILERHEIVIPGDDLYSIVGSFRTGGDSILLLSDQGLYLRETPEGPWQKLLGNEAPAGASSSSPCDEERTLYLVSPSDLWPVASNTREQWLALDHYCGRLYAVEMAENSSAKARQLSGLGRNERIKNFCVQSDLIVSCLFRENNQPTIVLQRFGTGSISKIFPCPPKLANTLDSVGLGNCPFGIPALNPYDSTIWLAIEGYNHLFILSMKGKILDSLLLAFPDFRRPPPMKSRIRSDAVAEEWGSKWTYTTSFSFAPPGYFILQYNLAPEVKGQSSRVSTRVWSTQRQVVELDVSPYWYLISVQSDGRVLFATRESDSTGSRSVIYVTRIEP